MSEFAPKKQTAEWFLGRGWGCRYAAICVRDRAMGEFMAGNDAIAFALRDVARDLEGRAPKLLVDITGVDRGSKAKEKAG